MTPKQQILGGLAAAAAAAGLITGCSAQHRHPPGIHRLEIMWEQAGGSASAASTAACIARQEGGRWMPGKVPLTAAEAVRLSDDGNNWHHWRKAGNCA
jgi:hypothetical protein